MKYPVRQVFEVIREHGEEMSLYAAKREAEWLEDEGGEFLYGGGYGNEQLQTRVEIFKRGKWVRV